MPRRAQPKSHTMPGVPAKDSDFEPQGTRMTNKTQTIQCATASQNPKSMMWSKLSNEHVYRAQHTKDMPSSYQHPSQVACKDLTWRQHLHNNIVVCMPRCTKYACVSGTSYSDETLFWKHVSARHGRALALIVAIMPAIRCQIYSGKRYMFIIGPYTLQTAPPIDIRQNSLAHGAGTAQQLTEMCKVHM